MSNDNCINKVFGLDALLRNWTRTDDAPPRVVLKRGERGHVNLTGAPDAPAVAFPYRHPQFVDALEPGVRALVLRLVERHGAVTYSSCEGHLSAGGDAIASPRHVAMVFHDEAARQLMQRKLQPIISSLRQACPAVEAVLDCEWLESDYGVHPSLNLAFLPRTSSARAYFVQLEPVYRRLNDDL